METLTTAVAQQLLLSSTEEKVIQLLGQNISPATIATSTGVSVSRISQIATTPEFAAQVSEIKKDVLAKYVARDAKYDDLEDSLLDKLAGALPLMYRPRDILGALSIINSAKRRAAPIQETSTTEQKEVISISIPPRILSQITVNLHNQIIQAGNQNLVTIQSGNMDSLLANRHETLQKELPHVVTTNSKGAASPG